MFGPLNVIWIDFFIRITAPAGEKLLTCVCVELVVAPSNVVERERERFFKHDFVPFPICDCSLQDVVALVLIPRIFY